LSHYAGVKLLHSGWCTQLLFGACTVCISQLLSLCSGPKGIVKTLAGVCSFLRSLVASVCLDACSVFDSQQPPAASVFLAAAMLGMLH
ncbi:hypothetical protein COO60DRAFT_1488080, partial [Scenedesmus sp. NREL 46B-D3]